MQSLIHPGHSLVRLHHFKNSCAGDTPQISWFCFHPQDTKELSPTCQYGHHGSKAVPSKIPWAKRFRLAGLRRWNLGETKEKWLGRLGQWLAAGPKPQLSQLLQRIIPYHRARCYSSRFLQDIPRHCTEKAPEE